MIGRHKSAAFSTFFSLHAGRRESKTESQGPLGLARLRQLRRLEEEKEGEENGGGGPPRVSSRDISLSHREEEYGRSRVLNDSRARERRTTEGSPESRLCPRGAKQFITVRPLTLEREPLIIAHFDDPNLALPCQPTSTGTTSSRPFPRFVGPRTCLSETTARKEGVRKKRCFVG